VRSFLTTILARTAGVLGLLLFVTVGLAAPASAQSLRDALAAAYSSNPTLLAARAELRSVNEGVPQALSGWRPNVSVNGEIGVSNVGIDPPGNDRNTQFPRSIDVTVVQSVYQGGTIRASVDSAEAIVQAQRQILRDTEQTVLLAAATAYMDVWQAQAVLELNEANEARLRREREATIDRFNVGEVTRTDVAQAEARLADAVSSRIQSEGDLRTSEAVFFQIIGIQPTNVQRGQPLGNLPTSVAETVSLAQQDAPNVVAARFLESSALADVRAQLGELLPSIDLVGILSYSDASGVTTSEISTGSLTAQVTVPLYQQGLVTSQVRQAKQVASQRRLEIDEALKSAEQTAVASFSDLETAQAQRESFETSVRANEIALEGVRQESLVGARTVLDVLDAEQELLQSQVQLVGAVRDEVVATYSVASSIGQLIAENLDLGVPIYEPQFDYEAVRDTWWSLTAPGAQ